MKKEKKPLTKGTKIAVIVILVVAVGVLGLSIYKLVEINQSYKQANDLYDDIAALNRSGMTVIMISHDLAAARQYATKTLHLTRDRSAS